MPATIKIKNSSTASAVPTSSDLVQGELAVNVTDKRIFTENASGTVVELGTNPSILTLPDGSASAPTLTNDGDTNTGIFFPAADTVGITTGGTERARVDSSGNLLVGTTSATYSASGRGVIEVGGSSTAIAALKVNGSGAGYFYHDGTNLSNWNLINGALIFGTNNTERARIDSSGNLLVGTTSFSNSGGGVALASGASGENLKSSATSTGAWGHYGLYNGNGRVGLISTNGTGTTYATSSDYRLKENIAPMTGALATVAQLKPCTYTWKADGAAGQGFIAHELQAVLPDAVVGEKDAVDVDGNPEYQGIDTSFLVATLTAAIQELKAEFDAYKASHP
jgi:hypothetical protein